MAGCQFFARPNRTEPKKNAYTQSGAAAHFFCCCAFHFFYLGYVYISVYSASLHSIFIFGLLYWSCWVLDFFSSVNLKRVGFGVIQTRTQLLYGHVESMSVGRCGRRGEVCLSVSLSLSLSLSPSHTLNVCATSPKRKFCGNR